MKLNLLLKTSFVLLLSSYIMISCNKDATVANSDTSSTNSKASISTMATTTSTSTPASVNPGIALLPTSGLQDKFYIVAKLSSKAITIVPEGAQLQQTELCYDTEPSSKADLTICYFGTKTNPDNFKPGTYTVYKIQWGSLSPINTLINHFWDVYNSSNADGAPVISWPSVDQTNQEFVFESTGDADNSVYIRSLSSGKYLQIAGSENTAIGAKLEQWGFNWNANQKFFIRKRKTN